MANAPPEHGVCDRERRRGLVGAAAAALLVLASACAPRPAKGGSNALSTTPAEAPTAIGVPQITWDAPLHGGLTVGSADEAQKHVSFQIIVPSLGKPMLIPVDNPDVVEEPDRLVAFVYQLPGDGTINVEEQLAPPGYADNLAGRAADPDAPSGMFQMIDLESGSGLLVTSTTGVGAIAWVNGDVLISITGPTLTPEGAQRLARSV